VVFATRSLTPTRARSPTNFAHLTHHKDTVEHTMDHLPPTYIEERLAADEAKRLAALQQEAIQQRAQQAQKQQITPRNLTQALLQRPPLSRPNSSGFLGGIYQGFVRAASASPSPLPSPGATPCATPPPGQVKPVMSAEAEKLIAEQKRDADIVCGSSCDCEYALT